MQQLSARDWLDPTRLYNPKHPAGRLQYLWGGFIVPAGIMFLVALVGASIEMNLGYYDSSPINDVVFEPVSYLSVLMWLLIAIRRAKDLGHSGWWLCLGIIPLVNLYVGASLFLADGVKYQEGNIETPSPVSKPEIQADSKPEFQQAKLRFCPNCGEKVVGTARFCISCGTELPLSEMPEGG